LIVRNRPLLNMDMTKLSARSSRCWPKAKYFCVIWKGEAKREREKERKREREKERKREREKERERGRKRKRKKGVEQHT